MICNTERLLLRPLTLDDKQGLYAYRSDAETNKFQGRVFESPADADEFLRELPAEIGVPDTWFQFGLIEKKSGKLIGDLGIRFFKEAPEQVELGITLCKSVHNKGFATEALKKVIQVVFDDLEKSRIIVFMDPRNAAAAKLVERLGFTEKSRFDKEILVNGVWAADVMLELTSKSRQKPT